MRHGESTDDISNSYGGWADFPLTEKGRNQAKVASKSLKKYKIDLILSSPLKRAFETAEIVGQELNVPVKEWLYLKERNTYGLMCGEKKSDMEKNYPELFNSYENGEFVLGSERYEDLHERLKVLIKKLSEFKKDCILTVTHGKVLACLCKELLGEEIDKKDDCSFMEVELENSKLKYIGARGISFK